MTRETIEYFKFQRKKFCEEYLKICPKDSIAYQATLKEKEFYDMAIKALEQQLTTNSNIPFIMHKEMDISLSECQKAYDVAIDYLRKQVKLKG